MAHCEICKKGAVSGSNVSHSKVHTKRKFKANIQKINGILLCTRCIKTIKTALKKENVPGEQIPEAVEAKVAE